MDFPLTVVDFPRFKHPFTATCAGPTQVGKSWFLKEFLHYRREMIDPPPDKVIWFYGIYQELFDKIPDVTFIEGFPSNFRDYLGTNTLIIIDDLMSEVGNDKRLTYLFSKGCHHLSMSVIFVTQNLFHKGSEIRDSSLNSQYLIVFKNRRDQSQIMHLGRQLYPGRVKFFREVFDDATKEPFAFLLIDLRNQTDEGMRLRTQILPNQIQYVYQLKYK